MERDKLTKEQIVTSYARLKSAVDESQRCSDIMKEGIEQTIKKWCGAQVHVGAVTYTMREPDVVISSFGNIINLNFVADALTLRQWKPDGELTPEEKTSDRKLMASYLNGGISFDDLKLGLASPMRGIANTICLEPSVEEVADIYLGAVFGITEDDEYLVVRLTPSESLTVAKRDF